MTSGWRWLLSGVATCGLVLTGAWAHATPAQVILIRHGDKDSQRGDYNLSPKGFERALSLGRMIPACFGAPNQIRSFELDPVSSQNSRSYQTAVPLAVATGVNIGIVMGSKASSARFGEEVLSSKPFEGAKAVFFWEHRHLPDLAKGLGWSTMAPIDAGDYDQLLLLSYSAGSKTPKVERLSQQELFKRACNGLTLDPGAASAGLQLEMEALNKAVGLPPKPHTTAAELDLAILLWLQKHRTPDQIAKSWLLLDRNIVQFDRALGIDMTKSTPTVAGGITSFLKLVDGAKDSIKDRMQRPRPFVSHPEIHVCLPPEMGWSFPSGHSAFFRSAAVLLADLVPERRERLLAVGLLGGTSRNICGLHYPSDVEAGQRLGEAAALQILNSPQWQQFKQNPAVQQEIEKIRQVPVSRLPQNDG
ncbi:MAG: phosphatase PAP2 family protein [Cyanobium sp. LacPavin_0920_WC12_MAG_62_9]|nr:phosphatase PAP2 family protein [Cyanobium sp. LacPavin_0920_WC12_MAG_62_9]